MGALRPSTLPSFIYRQDGCELSDSVAVIISVCRKNVNIEKSTAEAVDFPKGIRKKRDRKNSTQKDSGAQLRDLSVYSIKDSFEQKITNL